MDTNASLITHTTSAEGTRAAGKVLASLLAPGDVITLSGDLGAGKTQFVQGVASGLGAREVPTSPTFNIVLSYTSGRLALHHFDLYRLDEPSQLEDIGLKEYLESGGVCFVEWAEKFPSAFEEHLHVQVRKTSVDGRSLFAEAHGKRFEELLAAWSGTLAQGDEDALRHAPADEDGSRQKHTSDQAEPAEQPCEQICPGEPFAPDAGLAQKAGAACNTSSSTQSSATSPEACESSRIVLAFDTANEVVALGIGALDADARSVQIIATREIQAHRASNTQLLPQIDRLLGSHGVKREAIACICVGRGPGSFTGVRIAMATAKGIAQALGVGLVGVSSLDAIAWNAHEQGMRGPLLVVADAMRKEVYPAYYDLDDEGATRTSTDRVVKAASFVEELADSPSQHARLSLAGDALVKYLDLFEGTGSVASAELWAVSGRGLLLALQDAWRAGMADPLDPERHDPALALPVYTRLSDAEENERIRLSKTDEKNLVSGVQDRTPDGGKGRATMHVASKLIAPENEQGIAYHPLDAAHAPAVAALESEAMGSDAWPAHLVEDELGRKDRTWWIAESAGSLCGYAGGMVVDGDLQVLKVAVAPAFRRRGVARELLARIADDARNLAAKTCSLEVRASNAGAQAFYEALGLARIGVRPRYYSDREDAVIMQGPLPLSSHDVAGMTLEHHEAMAAHETPRDRAGEEGASGLRRQTRPLIMAIESSCDETAAAIVDGSGELLSDVVASQIDFHARFGGVVPEIASRKHIEAICGVCAEALASAAAPASEGAASRASACWSDLDAIAVTYAPGLVGALVVGVAFAKGAAWALDIPFIGVNHLEGHLYANKIGTPDFNPPAVVSLVSGGNTMLVHMRGWGDYETLGTTIDDAVGEAFDKVSKALGLGYPGGPVISRMAAQGDPDAIDFPRAMLHSHDLRFSLSGLKTAVVNYINKERQAGRELNVGNIAASFQQAVIDVQVAKAKSALKQTGAKTFCLGGGVAANPALRAAYEDLCTRMGVKLVMPPLSSCGDNAGMIALVALDRYRSGKFFGLDADAYAHADLDEPY